MFAFHLNQTVILWGTPWTVTGIRNTPKKQLVDLTGPNGMFQTWNAGLLHSKTFTLN